MTSDQFYLAICSPNWWCHDIFFARIKNFSYFPANNQESFLSGGTVEVFKLWAMKTMIMLLLQVLISMSDEFVMIIFLTIRDWRSRERTAVSS